MARQIEYHCHRPTLFPVYNVRVRVPEETFNSSDSSRETYIVSSDVICLVGGVVAK